MKTRSSKQSPTTPQKNLQPLPQQFKKQRKDYDRNPKMIVKTKQDAIKYFNSMKLGENSIRAYTERLEFLCDMFKSDNVDAILKSPEKVKEKIETATWRNNPDKLISVETQKLYWIMIRILTKFGNVKSVGKAEQKQYNDFMLNTAKFTEHERGKNQPKQELENYPELTWEDQIS